MKKLMPLLLVLLLGFTACNTDSDSARYVGDYNGTFTMVTENTTKSGTVKITTNPLVPNGLLLYYAIPLNYESEGTFTAQCTDSQLMTQVLTAILGDNAPTAEQMIKNMEVKAIFEGSQLSMSLSYEVELAPNIAPELTIIKFVGTK